MGGVCALCLLVARLAPAPDTHGDAQAPAPVQVPAPTRATTDAADTVPTDEAVSTPATPHEEKRKPAPPQAPVALRDPFAAPFSTQHYRSTMAPDLLDPFTGAPHTEATKTRDLRDPFVAAAAASPCTPMLHHGIRVQRPQGLEPSVARCAVLDRPLRNPFSPPTAAPTQSGRQSPEVTAVPRREPSPQ